MAKSMSPSEPITSGQAAKFLDIQMAALRKSGLPSAPTQQVLETQADQLSANFVADVRKRVEAISDLIVRHVKVDRTRSPQAVLDATGRNQYTDRNVVKSMPHGEGEETDVVFFKVSRFISDDDLEKEFELRNLTPVDPYSLAQVNADDPAFTDEHPNGTHWEDVDGRWCFATVDRWLGERYVHVYRHGYDWDVSWWFGGLRK